MKGIAIAFAAILALSACTPTVVVPVAPPVATPIVVVPAGLRPRLTPADVEQLVLGQIHSMERIAGVVLRPPRVVRIVAVAGGVGAPGVDGITWKVDAEGTFAIDRGPAPGSVPPTPTGHLEISDADGTVLSLGMP